MTDFNHIPVLLKETIESLEVSEGKRYIDATLGGGGHTREIVNRGGIVLGIDQDRDALRYVEDNFKLEILNLKLKPVWGNFKNITKIAQENNFTTVSGILFDLGISSYQLDSEKRGFSIRNNAPLDMRMDIGSALTAREIVNSYSEEDLAEIFIQYGEDINGSRIAAEIVERRKEKEIETTGDLVALIENKVKRTGKLHPATKIFQALRIEVNSELTSLKSGLEGAIQILEKKGRIVAISFHSLEDRIVKRTFDRWHTEALGMELQKKPITALEDELLSNPRARSAKLRVFVRS